MEDDKGFVFGAFCSESWNLQNRYYGTGLSFLFKLHPKMGFYPWTGKNDYIMSSKEDGLAIGGGDGQPGLWLDCDLLHGSSFTCETFQNDILANQQHFTCSMLEVWGFASGFKKD